MQGSSIGRHRAALTIGVAMGVVLVAASSNIAAAATKTTGTTKKTTTKAATTTTAAPVMTTTPLATLPPSGPQLPATVTDATGKSVTVKDVSRIVSIFGSNTEVVFALGLGPKVAAVDTTSLVPASVTSLPQVGNNTKLTPEGILSQRPTVVIASTTSGPPEALDAVRAAGIPVVVVPEPTDLTKEPERTKTIATALGVPGEGAKLTAAYNRSIEQARATAKKFARPDKPVVAYVQPRTNGIAILGTGNPSDAIIREAGGVNAAALMKLTASTQTITPEALIGVAPDVIITASHSIASAGGVEGFVKLQGVAQTPAVLFGQVYVVDGPSSVTLGPRSADVVVFLADKLSRVRFVPR